MAHEFQREDLRRETLEDSRLPCKRNPPFVFAHFPDSWEMAPDGDGGWAFMPRMKCMRLEPGVNGIRGESYDAVRPQLFFANLRAEGWIIIDSDEAVVYHDEDGELVTGERGYLGSRPCRHGKVYCSVWDRPIVSGRGRRARVDWKTKKDVSGFNEWKLMLVATGVIPKPSEAGLNELIRVQTRRARRQAGKAGDNKYLQDLVSKESERLDAMIKARADLYAAAPKKRRGKSKRKGLEKEVLDLE